MARLRPQPDASGKVILVVDDNHEYLTTTERLLRREGHHVVAINNPRAGLDAARGTRFDLILVDYCMPEMNGEQFVAELRTFDALVQVILQTGYASEQPAREMLRRLDIQGYFDKTDGPDKQLIGIDAGLKAAFTVQALQNSRAGLQYILDVTPDLHRLQPVEDLLQGVLLQTTGLLGAISSFVAVSAPEQRTKDGFLAMLEDSQLRVCAGTGRFERRVRVDECIEEPLRTMLEDSITSGKVHRIGHCTVLPLRVGNASIGAIYLDSAVEQERDLELLGVFASQAAVALHNAQLYEMAAFDPLTRVYSRRFLLHALLRELRVAHRSRADVSILLVDLDGMKAINDTGGHLAGDAALAAVGSMLRQVTRAGDVVGRYGGDEFAVVLPHTDLAGARCAAARVLEAFRALSVAGASGHLPVRGTVGVATLVAPTDLPAATSYVAQDAFSALGNLLLKRADDGLYAAKRAGRGRAGDVGTTTWFDALAALASSDRSSPNADVAAAGP